MTMKLYELAGADVACRFSQHCWRVRLVLHHKGLDWEGIPWRFTEKDAIEFAGTKKVPVLVDGERVVHDSWTIIQYLEDEYPDTPSVFGDATARAEATFFKHWTERVVQVGMAPMIIHPIFERLHEKDKAYFRETREKRFGRTLEEVAADTETRLPAFRDSLAPLRATLEQQPFVAGGSPMIPDYLLYAAFLWVRHGSDLEMLEAGDPVSVWRDRMDDVTRGA